MTNAIATRPKLRRLCCARCGARVSDHDVRAAHLCGDLLRSEAFEGYLVACARSDRIEREAARMGEGEPHAHRLDRFEAAATRMFAYAQMRPWERDLAEDVLLHAADLELLARYGREGLPS